MRHHEIEVNEALVNSVKGYWYREIDFGAGGSTFEVLPDGHAEIIFYFGSGCNVMVNNQRQSLASPFIVGLLNKPVHFNFKGVPKLIGIKCLPWAVCDLLSIPSFKPGVNNLTHPIASLQNLLTGLLKTEKVDEALLTIQKWLLDAGPVNGRATTLSKAGTAILNTNGSTPVTWVAQTAHTTVRTLERKFKASSGYTVKDVSCLVRFEQARDRLWENPDVNIIGLACELGFTDQSHLNREFKRFSGVTAAAFAKQFKDRKKRQ